jgi:hypothetical protein
MQRSPSLIEDEPFADFSSDLSRSVLEFQVIQCRHGIWRE